MVNCIDSVNAIVKNNFFKKANQECIIAWGNKKMGSFDILIDISEHVTLVQLMDYLGNTNHSISVLGYWIFD